MPFQWIRPATSRFDEADVQGVIEAGARLAASIPWTVDAPDEFYDAVTTFGFVVSGKKVMPNRAVVDRTLAAAEELRRSAPAPRDGESLSPELRFSVSGQALWCCDPETDKLRPATVEDQAAFSRVVNAFPRLGRTHPTFIPQDVPLQTAEFHSFVTILLNSDKPYRVSAYSPEVLPYFLEALTIYHGSGQQAKADLAGDLIPAKAWINTPCMLSREAIAAAMRLRELTGRPLSFGSMPVAGMATPVTPAGALALITAEVIGANAFSLALDGRLAGWTASPCSVDMKTGTHAQWAPEVIRLTCAANHVADALFGGSHQPPVPTYTSAKRPGEQSMMERAFGFGFGFLSGARSFGSLATLATADVGSVVELMLDMELVSAVTHLAKGFEVDQESLAEDLIADIAPQGARFLDTEHTARHFRSTQWIPELLDRRVPMAWVGDERTMLDNARTKALRLLKTAPNRCPLDEGKRGQLKRLLAEADRELS
ncbi:MAG: hypothetical protein HPY83_15995 [Anaerolineae bacterium]|nr:hypothetical protein [Anaerolineae bacterium]